MLWRIYRASDSEDHDAITRIFTTFAELRAFATEVECGRFVVDFDDGAITIYDDWIE